MKRALIVLGVVLGLLLVPIVIIGLTTFVGMAELVDGTDVPGGAKIVKDGFSSMTVVPAGDGAVALIDCGDNEDGAPLIAELKRRGLGLEAVKAVFLTHAHPDHIGACHLLKNADIMVLPGDVPLIEGTGRAKGPVPSKFDTPVGKRVKITHPLTDGETITVGPLNVKVYAVPGHTAGSAAFLANEVLYVGDNAGSTSDGRVKGSPWVFSDDTDQNKQSLVALAARLKSDGATVKKIVFAHSGPLDGMDALQAFKP
jgi:glyoxylase-like metal-dependent hydrolase (beta-lactamase superfamily II)